MPHVSVFIPTHRPTYLADALASLVAQTTQDWEAIVLVNGGAAIPHRLLSLDPRIHFHTSQLGDGAGIGALKAEAVDLCIGEVLVELDHDDLLLPRALRKIRNGFMGCPEAGLVYSDTLWIDQAGAPTCPAYAHGHGWEYAPATAAHGADYPVTPAATPHNVSLIWYAPNHVRAFTRTAYDAVGGYDPTLSVLDDQDLMARLYAYGPFVKTPRPVYVQRVHDQNTQADPETNAAIQTGTWDLYERHLEAMALADAERRGLWCLDLGGAHGAADPRYTVVEQYPKPEGEAREWVTCTLPDRLPLPDQSVGVIRAHDFLEHVTDKVALINELHRVLAPGGLLLSLTPSTDGRGAFQDPTHVAFYNEHSFWYYTQEQTAAYVPEVTARFQVSRLRTYFPTPWHAEVNISYVQANLIALHHPDQPRQGGLVGFQEFQ